MCTATLHRKIRSAFRYKGPQKLQWVTEGSYSLTCINYFNWQRKQALIMIILYSYSCSEMGAHLARAGRAGHKFQTFTGDPDSSMTGVDIRKT